jgi:hypothetical protein
MIPQRWDVISRCRTCSLERRVDLRVITAVRGSGFVLWNRMSRCRRTSCHGVVDFLAKAPGMGWHEPLDAPWPEGKPAADEEPER